MSIYTDTSRAVRHAILPALAPVEEALRGRPGISKARQLELATEARDAIKEALAHAEEFVAIKTAHLTDDEPDPADRAAAQDEDDPWADEDEDEDDPWADEDEDDEDPDAHM